VHHDQVPARRHGHRPGRHDQVPMTHSERRCRQWPWHHDQLPATHNERRRGLRPVHHDQVPAAKKNSAPRPSAALPGAGVWRSAWGDCARRPSTARHATFNDQVFAGSLSKVINLDSLLWGKLVPVASHQSPRRSQKICFSPAAVFTEPPVVREFCSKL
jgi:hypothetical protein